MTTYESQVQPMTPTYMMPPAAPPQGHYKRRPVFSEGLILALVLVGLILFFVGMMVVSSSSFLKAPTQPEDWDQLEQYYEDLEDYQEKVRNMVAAGRILIETGGLIVCLGLFGGAINNDDLNIGLRVTFVSAGIAFMISVMIILNIMATWTTSYYG
jgi:hypothetical protein